MTQGEHEAARLECPVSHVLSQTNWSLLAEQKLALIETIAIATPDYAALLQGLLHFMDALQDAACEEGHRVVYLTDAGDDAPCDAIL